MSDEVHETDAFRLNISEMPESVQRLADAMSHIDPNWQVEQWLEQAATNALELLNIDLEREKLRLEHKMHRVKTLSEKINPQAITPKLDPGQTNLFDCFDFADTSFKNISIRAEEESSAIEQDVSENTEDDSHPANIFLSMMPGEITDDPLLAITSQLMLVVVDDRMAKGHPFVELDHIFDKMVAKGVNVEEIDEALDYLLNSNVLIEVDDDCFVPYENIE